MLLNDISTILKIFDPLNPFFQVAAEVAHPLSQGVEKVTMVSTGNGEIGAAKLTGEVMDIVARVSL